MLLKQFKDAIKRYNLISAGEHLVVGVSGGPDSTALILLLNELKKELKLKLYVAHLDHMLRKDSRKDKEFTEALALKLKLPFISAKINIKKQAKKGSIEEIARNLRLDFLFKSAEAVKAKTIALGHNLDDQAETVLMRVLRGAGLYGLSAISPKRNIAGYKIIRPLIEIKRKQIEAFLKKKKIEARVDASNSEDIYFRNKIRNKLLPLIEKEYNKNIKEVLANTADSLSCDYDYLLKQVKRAAGNKKVSFNVNSLLKMHPAIRRLVFRQAVNTLQGSTRRITFQHIKELDDLLLNRPDNSIVDLPRGVSAKLKSNKLSFYFRRVFFS